VPQRKVHLVGYCIGGTLLSIGAAALARDGDQRPASMTMFAAQADFSEPGELAFFINPSQLAMLEATMHRKGVLESKQMGGAFALLRAKDLVWQPIVDTLPEGPARADDRPDGVERRRHPHAVADALGIPVRLYLDNELATNRFPVGGRLVRLSDIACRCWWWAPRPTTWRRGSRSTDRQPGALGRLHFPADRRRPQRRHRLRAGASEAHYRIRTRGWPIRTWRRGVDGSGDRHDGSWWPALHGWLAKPSSGRTKPRRWARRARAMR